MDQFYQFIERRWRLIVLATWLGFCIYNLIQKWGPIQGLGLGDTDDNMRLAQVRAWLGGQGWFDLRQYKLDPPAGANIHWSRIVDLPIAGLILATRPFVGTAVAERIAVAIAPLLPMLLLMLSLGLTVRRIVGKRAVPLALATLLFAGSTAGMYMPLRIDHHGWQIALLALGLSGVADRNGRRGGLTLGLASAASLAIGLEMLIYIALSGVTMVLFWVADRTERDRLASYAVSLSGGTALGFLLFASDANRLAVCDALSPVWLADAVLGGALLLLLAWRSPERPRVRLGFALGAGVILAAFHALAFPQCLSRLEGVPPDVTQLWLSHVREARPIFRYSWRVATLMAALPATALVGWALLGWRDRRDPVALRHLAGVAVPSVAAFALMFWQTRATPAAQMLAIPGSIAILYVLLGRFQDSRQMLVRTIGTVLLVLLSLGALAPFIMSQLPPEKAAGGGRTARANRDCASLRALTPLNALPPATIFTFVDLAPRLIVVTHHRSIAGPYHRNYRAIGDVMHAFRGTADEAHGIVAAHRSAYLMICPAMSQATIFTSETPNGFYSQLAKGTVPAWLQPVALPKGSPLKLWRVVD